MILEKNGTCAQLYSTFEKTDVKTHMNVSFYFSDYSDNSSTSILIIQINREVICMTSSNNKGHCNRETRYMNIRSKYLYNLLTDIFR